MVSQYPQKIKTSLVVLLSYMLLSLMGCSDDRASTENDNADTTNAPSERVYGKDLPDNAPTYLVAVEAAYAPFAFRDDQGFVVGYDEDILAAIGEVQGFKVEFMHQGWDGIFDTLAADTRDIVASGISLTEERLEYMDATDPVFKSADAIYVSADSPYASTEDLHGKTISAQADTSMETRLRDLKITTDDNVKGYDTMYLAFRALLAGEVDAVYGTAGVLNYYTTNLPDGYYPPGLKLLEIKDDTNPGLTVFYVDKGDTALLTLLNEGLAKIRANGTYAEINQKWFGISDSLQ